jgi:site-specific DNA recombinase
LSLLPPPPSLPPGSLIDCYIRDSGGPKQEASTDQQLLEIEAFCRTYGLVLRNVFRDAARSGGSTVGREEFNRLIDLTRLPENRPQGLLLWNFARFSRDLDDAVFFKYLLRQRGVVVHSLTDPVPEGQFGRVVEILIDISNEEKRRQTSSDARRGLHDLVKIHGCVPGVPPRGFIRQAVNLPPRRDGSPHVGHRWVPDPATRSRVRRAFEMRAEGSTLKQIHDELRLFGSINSYKTFFSNRLYIGILEFGGEVIEGYCEPLVDMPTWNLVQERIQAHAQAKFDRHHPRRAHSPYLLSGLVYCGECGAPMSANTVTQARGRNEAYRCSRSKRHAGCTQGRIGRKKLETAVLATLRDYILLPDMLAEINRIQATGADRNEAHRLEHLASLSTDRRRLTSQIANLTRAIAEKGHSQALLDRLTELEAQRAQLIGEIHQLETRRFEALPVLNGEQIAVQSERLGSILASGPNEPARQLLQAFIHRIDIKKTATGQVAGTITYYSPPFDLPSAEGLPMGGGPLGAPPYRQTFTHPIIQNR